MTTAFVCVMQLDTILAALTEKAERGDMQLSIIHRSNYNCGGGEKGKWLADFRRWSDHHVHHIPVSIYGQHDGATMIEALDGLYKAIT